jgi:DNA-binding MarR family transcriptional regulator
VIARAISILADAIMTESAYAYIVADDGIARWSAEHADAWVGFLEAHKRLTRALDAELESEHGLGFSAAEALGRLAAAPGRCLRLSELAAGCGLSLSRVSRLVDALERRGLVEKRRSPSDARATDAHLTEAGLAFTRKAQATHFASVQRRFFDQLDAREIATLAKVFRRVDTR